MPRVKGGPRAHKRHKKVLKLMKGQLGARSRLFRRSNEAMLKSLTYAYHGRRLRRRDMRRLWITRINAAARLNGLSYGRLMNGLKRAGVGLDRKILADMAIADAAAFSQLAEVAKAQLQN